MTFCVYGMINPKMSHELYMHAYIFWGRHSLLIEAWWSHMVSEILVNTGSGNGLVGAITWVNVI